jgi:hypothetical protein
VVISRVRLQITKDGERGEEYGKKKKRGRDEQLISKHMSIVTYKALQKVTK